MKDLETMAREWYRDNCTKFSEYESASACVCTDIPAMLAAFARYVEAQRWIPVEELPKEQGYYLVTLEGGIVGKQSDFFWADTQSFNNPCVTHWQPLPPSPEVTTASKEVRKLDEWRALNPINQCKCGIFTAFLTNDIPECDACYCKRKRVPPPEVSK